MEINVRNKHHGAQGQYIGRGSPLGNPFTHMKGTKAEHLVETREAAIAAYETWLNQKIEAKDDLVCDELNRLFSIAQKGELDLVCFCAPKPCHGDVIRKVLIDAHTQTLSPS